LSDAKDTDEIRNVVLPKTEVPNTCGICNISDFRPMSCYISGMVQEWYTVTVEGVNNV